MSAALPRALAVWHSARGQRGGSPGVAVVAVDKDEIDLAQAKEAPIKAAIPAPPPNEAEDRDGAQRRGAASRNRIFIKFGGLTWGWVWGWGDGES